MALQERREREKEEMKEKILSAASAIVREEGYENLSIRKIANKIEYSPTIIYHYFVDKDEIIYYLMQRGYRKIVQAITCANSTSDTPEGHLKDMTRNYIDVALKMPDEYMSAQLSKS
ncbi:MAG TPA: TetR/AcrR family transcriptional regulator, partial [Clostridiales bacterium]|nr:TetR/AcrR family transcriptional regulator [Clostridiales bacterium]